MSSFTINRGEIYGLIGPERRRQDLAVQRAHRHLHAGRRQLHVRRRAARQPQAEPGRRARHRAHVPEHPPVPEPVGARERDDRPARAHRTPACSARSSATRARCAEEAAHREARLRAARVRRRRQARQQPRQASRLRRPAPARDRARAGHRAEAARARRARRRHERDRDAGAEAICSRTSAATARRSC